MFNEQWIHTRGSYEIFFHLSFAKFDLNVFKAILTIEDFSIWPIITS